MLELTVNGRTHRTDVEPDMPLLWVLRDHLNLPGTKYGCGIAVCGACTVHIDGEAVRACALPVSAAAGKKIVTIEGLSKDGLHRIQKAWIEHEVPQCGYCQTAAISDDLVGAGGASQALAGAPATHGSFCSQQRRT